MATLFIGIGSSGLKVLEEAQQFNYEFTGKNKSRDVHYLYLETDLSNKPSIIAAIDLVPIRMAIKPIAGKNLPRETLESANPIEV